MEDSSGACGEAEFLLQVGNGRGSGAAEDWKHFAHALFSVPPSEFRQTPRSQGIYKGMSYRLDRPDDGAVSVSTWNICLAQSLPQLETHRSGLDRLLFMSAQTGGTSRASSAGKEYLSPGVFFPIAYICDEIIHIWCCTATGTL